MTMAEKIIEGLKLFGDDPWVRSEHDEIIVNNWEPMDKSTVKKLKKLGWKLECYGWSFEIEYKI